MKIAGYKGCSCRAIDPELVATVKKQMPAEEFCQDVADRFRLLADPTRLKIVYALSLREMCVYDLANMLDMTQSAVSHQLRTLKQAKVVAFRKNGKMVCYSLAECDISKLFNMVSKQLIQYRRLEEK